MVKKFKNTARPEGYKSYLSRGGRWLNLGKNSNKYMIVLVGVTMLFSGLYVGLNREMPGVSSENDGRNYTAVNYDSASLYGSGVLAQVEAVTGDYKLIPKNAGMFRSDSLDIVFESNLTGVTGIILENAPGYEMFNIATDGRNVTAEIRKRIRLPGDYNLYRVYTCNTQYGPIAVVGDNLEMGDYVKVLVLGRVRGGMTQLLGFAQNKIPQGPFTWVRVVSMDSLQVTGVTDDSSLGMKLNGVLNLTDFRTQQLGGNSSGWAFTFNLPVDSGTDTVMGLASAYNMTNVTVAVTGVSQAPGDLVIAGKMVTLSDDGLLQTTFKPGVRVNDTIEVKIYTIDIGNRSVAFAIETSGNGTAVQ